MKRSADVVIESGKIARRLFIATLLLSASMACAETQREAPARVPSIVRILLWVDDHPNWNSDESDYLVLGGWKIQTCTTTEDAIKQLRLGTHPSLIISDMTREEAGVKNALAGLELIKAVRKLRPDLPILVYTSPQESETISQCVTALGGQGTAGYPVDLFEMIADLFPPPPE